VWCRKVGKIVASEMIILPCGHSFHNKLCLFRFVVCMSDNLRKMMDLACPICAAEMSHSYIREMLGGEVYDEAAFLYTKDLCLLCYDRNAEYYCKSDHCSFCSKCAQFCLYLLKKCPSCGSIKCISLPASTKDKDIESLLTRPSP
jgi:hypothetical protein